MWQLDLDSVLYLTGLTLARVSSDEPKQWCFAQVGMKCFASAACSIVIGLVGSGEGYTIRALQQRAIRDG